MRRVVRLREAAAGDAGPCAAILREWVEETEWFPRLHPPAADAPFVAGKIAAGEVIVAEIVGAEDETVVGFLAVEPDGWVSCLYVARGARRRGVGQALLDRAKARCGALRLWTFEANAGARAFYAREGFAEGRRTAGDNEEGLPDVELTWEGEA